MDKSAPDLAKSGKDIGEKISDGVGESLDKSVRGSMAKHADDIGDAIGRRMAENMGRSLRKRAGAAFTSGFANIKSRVTSIGDNVKGEWQKVSDKWASLTGKNFGKKLKGFLVSGIALAITALPSIIAFAGAIAGALGASLITALSAIGPAAAGAGLAAVAAFGTMKLSAGLLGLAMKAPSAALDDFQKRSEAFKGTIAAPIQAGLFSGFNAAIRISGPLVKSLQPMLKEFGTNVGDIAINFADAFRQASMMERVQRILVVNNDAVKVGGAGVVAFAQAFAVLFDHLSPVIEYLASGVRTLGEWALTAILAAEASGRLDTFIGGMFNSLTYFVGILVDFGKGIWNVFTAAHQASGGMLPVLQGIASRFAEWTGSEEGQTRMIGFFNRMRVITSRVLNIFGELTRAAGKALEGTDVDSVLKGLDGLVATGKAVASVFSQIKKAAGDKLGDAFLALANMLVNLANSGVLGTLASAFANLFNIVSLLLTIPGVAQLLTLVAGLAAMFKTVQFLLVVLKPLQIVFTVFRIALVALAGVVGWIPVVIGLLVAALIWFFTQTEIGRNIIAAVWDFIKNAISSAVDWIIGAWDWMVAAFKTAAAWVSNLAQSIWSAVSTAFNAVVTAVTTAFTTVRDFIVGVWNAIWGFIQPIIQGIWDFIVMVVSGIVTAVQWYLDLLYQIWIRIWPILALPIRVLYGVIMLIFTAVWDFIKWVFQAIWDFAVWAWNGLVAGISAAITWVQGVIQDVWNAIWGFIQPIIQSIVDFVTERWNNLVNNIKFVLDWVSGIISDVWNSIKNFLQPIIQAIVDFFVDRWNNLVNNIQSVLNWVKKIITDVWNDITGFLRGAMNTISDLISSAWDVLGDAGSAAMDGIKKGVNAVIGAINTVIDGINWAIDLANKLPGPDIPNIPSIPKLARGGVVSPNGGGTLAMIAEAGRPERVEPLDPQGLSARDRAIIAQLSASGGNGKSIHVYLGTGELREFVDVVVEEREDSLADRVLTGAKG